MKKIWQQIVAFGDNVKWMREKEAEVWALEEKVAALEKNDVAKGLHIQKNDGAIVGVGNGLDKTNDELSDIGQIAMNNNTIIRNHTRLIMELEELVMAQKGEIANLQERLDEAESLLEKNVKATNNHKTTLDGIGRRLQRKGIH